MIMKKIYKLFLVVAALSLGAVSCEIERFPYDQIEQTQAFKTMKDAQTINNGMYAQLRSRVYGIHMFSTDVQADQFNASLDFGNRNGFPHRWEGFLAGDYTIRDVWRNYYSALVNVNNIIQNMGTIPTTTPAEQATLDGYLGEAYLLRALYYHKLVQRWGLPYNASTSANDLGVPLVLEFNPTLKPSRATVAAVYQQILSDITNAKNLLPAVTAPNIKRVTRDAALALEARVLLHMEDYPAVVTVANELIGTNRYPLITTEVALQAMWTNDVSSEVILQVHASAPSELPANANVIYLGYNAATTYYTPDFIPQQWVVDLFAPGDIRTNVYLEELPVRVQGVDYNTGIYLFNKYPGNPALFTAATTNYQHKPIVFRIAETYLNLAEAQFYVNEGAALTTLNAFRNARGLADLVGLTGDALRDAIREERTRELLGEGFRLNDLMRWGLPVVRQTPQNTGPLNVTPADHYISLSKPVGHYQFIWGIPTNDLTTNPNMVQNPNW
jgi:starch-binding outer membrane protein, SusD/RagB family